METQQQQQAGCEKMEASEAEGRKESTCAQPQQQQQPSPVASASSSPSHEFSFTVSLHSSATTTPTRTKASAKSTTKSSPALAIDLSPADEIFYHGHLLPLHLISHLHTSSARPSIHSLDGLDDEKPLASATPTFTVTAASSANSSEDDYNISFNNTRSSIKSKSFSLFGLPKWKKSSETVAKEKLHGMSTENCNKRKLKFEVTQFLKKYLKMVKPILSPNKGGRRETEKSYSFSGTVSPRDHSRGMRRGEYSAPASMRTSPTNSGLLLATAGVPSPVSESTMEDLQAAIQAAIAHCKNSVSSTEDKSQQVSSVPVN